MAEGAKHPPVARRRHRAVRLRRVEVRVSEEEYIALMEKGAAVGGMSKLLRDHLGHVSIRHREDERRRLALLNRVNANLNMVAKWCNTYKSAADAVQILVYLATVEREVRRVLAAMERL